MRAITVGSIVCRAAGDHGLAIGQVLAADETLPPGKRWIVLETNGAERRWHAATIMGRVPDWERAAYLRGLADGIERLREKMDQISNLADLNARHALNEAIAEVTT